MALTRRQDLILELETRANKDWLPSLIERMSLSKDVILSELNEQELATQFRGDPSLEELQVSAKVLGKRSNRKALLLSSVASLGGALSLTPEALGLLLQELRHSQRLAVVFGVDPGSGLGKLMTWKTMAASFKVDLPEQTLLGVELRSLNSLNTPQDTHQTQIQLILELVLASIRETSSKKSRLLPALGIAQHTLSMRRQKKARHERMVALYEEGWLERYGELPQAQDVIEL